MANESSFGGYFLDKFGFVFILVSVMVAMLLLVEFPTDADQTSTSEIVVTILVGAILIVALLAAGVTRPLVRIALIAAGASVVLAAIGRLTDAASPGFVRAAWLMLILFTPVIVLRRILRHHVVTSQTLLGAASVYLLLAVTAMIVFMAINDIGSSDFFGTPQPSTTFMYFSLITLTTTGYGDFTPAAEVGRAAAAFTAVTGQVYLVFIVARLVSLATVSEAQGPSS